MARTVQPFCLLSFELEHKYPRGGSKFLFSYWFLNVTNYRVCISILFCFKLDAFPEKVPLLQLQKVTNQTFQVNVRKTTKEAKCAICKKTITTDDLQASTEGAYRTIHRTWILRTFFFCPSMSCMTKMPRNSFIIPFSPSQMTLNLDPDLTQEQRLSVGILWFNTTCTSWDIVCYSS